SAFPDERGVCQGISVEHSIEVVIRQPVDVVFRAEYAAVGICKRGVGMPFYGGAAGRGILRLQSVIAIERDDPFVAGGIETNVACRRQTAVRLIEIPVGQTARLFQ